MRKILCLLFLSLFSAGLHAECREVIKWDGGAGLFDNPGDACISIKPDNAERFNAGWFNCPDYRDSCTCQWDMKNSGWPPVVFGEGTVHRTVVYEGDSCPGQCVAGERRYREVRFPASFASGGTPFPLDPVDVDGCEAVPWFVTVSGCYVDADDSATVICGVSYELTGNPSSGDMPPVQEPAPTGVTDSRMSFELETTSTPSTVTNPDGSTTTVTVEEKTVSNPPAAVITETDTSVSFVQTSATSYDKITTTTTTTTYPDGSQTVVTEVTRVKETMPSAYTSIDKTTGSYNQTVTPGRTETGTTTTTEHIDPDGNVTNRTVINHGGGGQGAGGVGAPGGQSGGQWGGGDGAPGDQGPQSTCGGPGQPPCQVEFDESDLSVPSMPSSDGSWWESSYPDGLAGIWAKHQGALNQTPLMVWLNSWSFANAGSCPSWSFNFNLGALGNLGSHALEVPCWLWDVIRAIVMLSALLLARRLVFGG